MMMDGIIWYLKSISEIWISEIIANFFSSKINDNDEPFKVGEREEGAINVTIYYNWWH